MISSLKSGLLLGLLALAAAQLPQCPDTIATNNPNMRTMCDNSTYFILPIPDAKVKSAIGGMDLIPVPQDKTLFPNGFPKGHHPVIVITQFESDIRMGPLAIQTLRAAMVSVPLVKYLPAYNLPFLVTVDAFIGSTDNAQPLAGSVPATVGTAEGNTLFLGQFTPAPAAFQSLGGGIFSDQVKQLILPNGVSGPAVTPAVADLIWRHGEKKDGFTFTGKAVHTLTNQAQVLNNGKLTGMCARNTNYFNGSFVQPEFIVGNVTLYKGTVPANPGNIPSSLVGEYFGYQGYRAVSQALGNNPQDCRTAAMQVDPASTQ